MSVNFQTKVYSRDFHLFKNTIWENVEMGGEISVQIETNEASNKINPYCYTIKAYISVKLETVVTYQEKERARRWLCVVKMLPSLTHP